MARLWTWLRLLLTTAPGQVGTAPGCLELAWFPQDMRGHFRDRKALPTFQRFLEMYLPLGEGLLEMGRELSLVGMATAYSLLGS